MRRNYSQPSGSASYQRRYAGFRGVDFTNLPLNVDISRAPYAENIIVNSAGVVHKRPRHAMYDRAMDDATVYGMGYFKPPAAIADHSLLIIHAGNKLYYNDWQVGDSVFSTNMAARPSAMFQIKERFYVLDGKQFYVIYFDDASNELVCKSVSEIATPVETQIAGYYLAEERTELVNDQSQTTIDYTWQFGEKGERNLLTGRRINTFCGDGIHKTFYLDAQHFKVYKVEMYRYVPDQGSTSTSSTVTIMSGTNIRKKPSMSGDIITKTTSVKTVPTTGETGNWYQILWEGATAYVNKSRVSGTSGTTQEISTDDKGWETVTGYTVSEDSDKKCTKIVFTDTPPAHPRGNGLPNIRVTGAVTEAYAVNEITMQNTGNFVLTIPGSALVVSFVPKVNGTSLSSGYSVERTGEYITKVTINSVNAGDVVSGTARKEAAPDKGTIEKCSVVGRFGEYNFDRIFYTGNPDHPNRDWYSEGGDPTIVLENSYTDIGDTASPIAGYLNYQSDMLIIKGDGNGDNLFRRTADTDGDMVIFPVRAYKGRGVTNPKAMANIKGECVFLTPEGVYEFVSSDLGSKYGTKEVSYTIKTKLLQENLSEAEMGVWGDWLLLSFPSSGHCYVADTTQQTAPSTSGGYGWEWFYWTGCGFQNMLYSNEENTLYFTRDGYKLCYTDMETTVWEDVLYLDQEDEDASVTQPIVAFWATPQDALEDPARYKYISLRGGIMHFEPFEQTLHYAIVTDGSNVLTRRDEEIETDTDISADYDFDELHASPEVPDVIINRRVNRFKYVQFVFMHDDPDTDGIGLVSLEFQYRFGRYIH